MDPVEQLISKYPQLNFIFDANMEDSHKGVIIGNTMILNSNQSRLELLGTVSEEIGHYETTVGDITLQDTPDKRKQERLARLKGHYRIVTPRALIEAYFAGMKYYWEVADWLAVTPDYVYEAVQYYKEVYGISFCLDGYFFNFGEADTLTIEKAPETIASSF